MELISREAAIEAIERNAYRHTYLDQIINIISNLPSAEVTLCHLDSPCEYQNADIAMPNAEKVGKWIEVTNKWGGLEIRCSECGAKVPRDEWGNAMQSAYCPNCGARMEQ